MKQTRHTKAAKCCGSRYTYIRRQMSYQKADCRGLTYCFQRSRPLSRFSKGLPLIRMEDPYFSKQTRPITCPDLFRRDFSQESCFVVFSFLFGFLRFLILASKMRFLNLASIKMLANCDCWQSNLSKLSNVVSPSKSWKRVT